MSINRDFAAFKARLRAEGARYSTRDAGGADIAKLSEIIERIGKAFEEFKSANDASINKRDAVTEAKIAKINDELTTLSEMKKSIEQMETRMSRPGAFGGGVAAGVTETPEQRKHRALFTRWLRAPADPHRQMELRKAQKELEAKGLASTDEDGFETRAVQTTTLTGVAGGFALPEIIEREIARLGVDASPMRQVATVRTVGSPDYKELFDINGAGFEWVGETGARSQSTTPDLAEVAPSFGTASARPRASEESIDDLFFDVERWLIESAAEAIGQGEGMAFVSGNGVNRPTGFLTGAPVATADTTRAFGVLQFVASGVAAGLPANPDRLYDLVYALRARYRANARWMTSKLVLAELRKYKDSTGQYLWQPSLSAGQDDRFMGFPIVEAEDMPAIAANAFPVAFGDFREGYLIADRVGMRITRDEITLPGFVQFYIRRRVGGRIRNSQAIKLLRCAI